MTAGTPPDRLYLAWRLGRFELVSCVRQLDEIRRVSRRPGLKNRLRPSKVGRMINEIRRIATMYDPRPAVGASPDPDDDFLLGLAAAAGADFLVTGDKSGLLGLKRYSATRIVTARNLIQFLD